MSASSHTKNVSINSFEYAFLPVEMRMPLKFGSESVSHVNCLRVAAEVVSPEGLRGKGWGETPLSVTWAWPSATLSYEERYEVMVAFCQFAAQAFVEVKEPGHPMEIGHAFLEGRLPAVLVAFNQKYSAEPMPYLAALIVMSAFDIAVHQAVPVGVSHGAQWSGIEAGGIVDQCIDTSPSVECCGGQLFGGAAFLEVGVQYRC